MRKFYFVVAVFIFLLQGSFANAQVKLYNKKESTISYSMNHPLHAWTGKNNDVSSIVIMDDKRSLIKQVAVSLKVASFDSENANRDSHMIEVTEALLYPTVTFQSTSIEKDAENLKVKGTLNFHGVSQVITFNALLKEGKKNNIEVTGSFTISMTQFNIKPPSLMGMATDDEIEIHFNMYY